MLLHVYNAQQLLPIVILIMIMMIIIVLLIIVIMMIIIMIAIILMMIIMIIGEPKDDAPQGVGTVLPQPRLLVIIISTVSKC